MALGFLEQRQDAQHITRCTLVYRRVLESIFTRAAEWFFPSNMNDSPRRSTRTLRESSTATTLNRAGATLGGRSVIIGICAHAHDRRLALRHERCTTVSRAR